MDLFDVTNILDKGDQHIIIIKVIRKMTIELQKKEEILKLTKMLRRERARTMAMEKPAKDIEIENSERKL